MRMQVGSLNRPEDENISDWFKGLFITGQIVFGTLHVIFVHRSSTPEAGIGKHNYEYSAGLVVLLSEIVKLSYCIVAYLWKASKGDEAQRVAREELKSIADPQHVLRFSIPAVVYAVENHIRFAVLKQLSSPVTWVVFSHSEIPIVALLTTFCLGRQLTTTQWISVVLLVDGVTASQVAICTSKLGSPCEHLNDFPLGALALVILAATLAASAGVCTEYLFKKEYSTSIHIQNGLLYSWGILVNSIALLVQEEDRIRANNLWSGWDSTVYFITFTMACTGLCVAAVVKHMSNIVKVYTSAVGLFLAAGLSAIFADFDMNLPFLLAATVVVCALILYKMDKPKDSYAKGSTYNTKGNLRGTDKLDEEDPLGRPQDREITSLLD